MIRKRGFSLSTLWTDFDLFDTYMRQSGMAGNVSGLQVHSSEELVAYLRRAPIDMKHIMVDPGAKAPQVTNVFEIAKLLEELEGI